MSLLKGAQGLSALEFDLDLEVCHEGHTIHLRGQGPSYKLALSNWSSLYQVLKILRSYKVGWGELWQARTILKNSGRRLGVTVKGTLRFSIGA
jgi:hypothetical protein